MDEEINLKFEDDINLDSDDDNTEFNDIDDSEHIFDVNLDSNDSNHHKYNDGSFSSNTNQFNYTFNSKFIDSDFIHDTTEEELEDVYSNVIPIRRFALAFILSFGIYGYYWFYKNTSYLKECHDLPISLKFRTLVYIFLPIGNFIVLYDLINTMKPCIEKKGIKAYSPALNILGFILLGFSFLGIWFYINVQESFNEYWKVEQAHLPIKRDFSNAEILIIFFTWLGVLALIVSLFLFFAKYKLVINV
ncbi:MAG: hypothetical protein LBV42_01760 [Methanobrevibacter sp.]|nr:hypothetical protein [Methanobrevibacter sp.]